MTILKDAFQFMADGDAFDTLIDRNERGARDHRYRQEPLGFTSERDRNSLDRRFGFSKRIPRL
ncbi:hypothetical protein [Rhizobium sp. NXC24]|uniref:hypothetical protein n=1 Tax=Rhizobium sp. NXC24 TaxID=2048897 RepID=UPI000CF24407|nr:hypothetical protein [Rhizobium sp. NXC24]